MNRQLPPVIVYGGSQPQPQPAQPTVVQTVSQVPPTVRIQRNNGLPHKDSHRYLGIIQMVAGSLCLCFSIIGFLVGSPWTLFGAGIYTGILFILAGLFGFLASRHDNDPSKSRCFLVACLVMNIIGSCAAVIGIGFASTEIGIHWRQSSTEKFQRAKAGIVLFIIILEFVVTIVHASFTCCSCCECCMPREVVHQPPQVTGTVVVQQVPAMTSAGQSPMPQQQYIAQQPIQGQMPQQQYTVQQPMQGPMPQQQYTPQQPMQTYPPGMYTQSTYPQQQNAAFSLDYSVGASAPAPPPYSETDLERK